MTTDSASVRFQLDVARESCPLITDAVVNRLAALLTSNFGEGPVSAAVLAETARDLLLQMVPETLPENS